MLRIDAIRRGIEAARRQPTRRRVPAGAAFGPKAGALGAGSGFSMPAGHMGAQAAGRGIPPGPTQPEPTMSDDNQTVIPRSFVDLFVPAGAIRPREPRTVIAERYELCEDMAHMLTEHAKSKLFELGVAETDVLQQMHRGLMADGSVLAADEAGWVTCRLAELLDWPIPALAKPA